MTARLLIGLALVGGVAAGTLAYRYRQTSPPRSGSEGDLADVGDGKPWTLVSFTSPLCHACKQTPGIVAEALGVDEDELDETDSHVGFTQVDVGERPDLARALDVTSTPTLVLLDHHGQVRFASESNPDPDQLARVLKPPVGV